MVLCTVLYRCLLTMVQAVVKTNQPSGYDAQ